MPDYAFETAQQNAGFRSICGVDEAGRGPLAGPVCAAAVILPPGAEIPGLDDSKKLTEKKRDALFDVIRAVAVAYAVAFASVEEIESLNILNAAMLAMERAVRALPQAADFALVDGNRLPAGLPVPGLAVVKGDGRSMSIAAASVLAKVSRDRLLLEYDRAYPQYGFARHKGYGTAAHIEAIRRYGPCELHRPSFLTRIR